VKIKVYEDLEPKIENQDERITYLEDCEIDREFSGRRSEKEARTIDVTDDDYDEEFEKTLKKFKMQRKGRVMKKRFMDIIDKVRE
jgi:hypothetical protein